MSDSHRQDLTDLEVLARNRERLFRFLAGQFASPPIGPETPPGRLKAAWAELAERFSSERAAGIVRILESGELDPVALDREFANLFQIPTGRQVTPIESVYRSASFEEDCWTFGRLRGPSWAEVMSAYSSAGFEPAKDSYEADHIACELQFLAELCAREAEAVASDDFQSVGALRADQKKFMDRHLLSWIHLLRHRVEQVSDNPYYVNLVHFVEDVLSLESAYLSRNGVAA